jgi:hypothetical protein
VSTDPRWALLDNRTQERLLLARQRDFETYRVLRDHAMIAAEAHQRSLERHAARTADRIVASAAAQGVADAEFARTMTGDLSDYGFDPGVGDRLIALRQRDVMAFVVAFATERDRIVAARKAAGEAAS